MAAHDLLREEVTRFHRRVPRDGPRNGSAESRSEFLKIVTGLLYVLEKSLVEDRLLVLEEIYQFIGEAHIDLLLVEPRMTQMIFTFPQILYDRSQNSAVRTSLMNLQDQLFRAYAPLCYRRVNPSGRSPPLEKFTPLRGLNQRQLEERIQQFHREVPRMNSTAARRIEFMQILGSLLNLAVEMDNPEPASFQKKLILAGVIFGFLTQAQTNILLVSPRLAEVSIERLTFFKESLDLEPEEKAYLDNLQRDLCRRYAQLYLAHELSQLSWWSRLFPPAYPLQAVWPHQLQLE